MTDSPVREALTDSIKYWEPRRLLYNVALGAIVLTYFALNYPGSKLVFSSLSGILLFFILCVLANVAYCAAYAVDLFAQMSGFKERWRKIVGFSWHLEPCSQGQ